MQKRIYRAISIIVITAVVFLGMLLISISYSLYSREAKNVLIYAADTALLSTDDSERLHEILTASLDFDVRITEIDSTGRVVYDSDAQKHPEDNHADRPEVAEAYEKGKGFSQRYSETMSQSTYYYAVLRKGNVIRFSRHTGGMLTLFIGAVPFFLTACGLVMIIAVIVSDKLAENIVKPLNRMIRSMNVFDSDETDAAEFEEYEELVPMYRLVIRMRREITDYISEISAEKETIGLITANMTEGMILIDGEDNIISVNRSAADMVNSAIASEAAWLQSRRNIIEFCRNEEFLALIRQSKNASGVTGTFRIEGRFLRAFISRIEQDGATGGSVIIIVDETEIRLAEEMRKDFSANVSHELRTPLTTVRGFAEMIGSGMITDPEDMQKYGKRIYDEATRLLNVINDIIRLSEIEENQGEIFTSADLLEIAREAASGLSEKAERLGISLKVTGENVIVSGDRGYIYEMILNLADNAVKYNTPGGRVLITVSRADDKAVITVADSGIGIPREHQSRIFERFYRVDKSRSKQTGGTGLGLSIVKHITAVHKGNITVESEEGKGTVFTVMLPA